MHDRTMVRSGILVEDSLFGAAAAYPAFGASHVGTMQGWPRTTGRENSSISGQASGSADFGRSP